ERIILSPDCEQGRPPCAEIFLELGIESDVAGVIQAEVELNFVVARPGQQRRVELVSFRRQERRILHSVRILPLSCFGLEELAQSVTILCRWLLPVFLDRIPAIAKPLFIGIAVLRDDGGDTLGVCQRQAESDRGAVIEDVDRETIETNGLGKAFDHLSQLLERVAELLPVGCIREPEARQIGRYHVVAIGERRNKVAKHVRRRWEAVQQENGWSSFRAGLAIKDVVGVDGSVLIIDHDEPSSKGGAGWPGLPVASAWIHGCPS